MRHRFQAIAIAVGVFLVAASCGKDSTGTAGAGRFTGDFTYGTTVKYSGPAYFELDGDGDFYQVFGWSSDDAMEFDFRPNGLTVGMPEPGTYPIGGAENQYIGKVWQGDEEFFASGGTVTITSVTSSSIKGIFDLHYRTSRETTATFKGTFNASKCPDC